jgi:hypothetical protein
MKKFAKIFFISVLSLLVVLIVTISIALWLVFTPERFTPIVRKQADKFITCRTEIGEVELTFFSTFPNFGLKVKQFALINPMAGSQSDTLVQVDEMIGIIDAAAWWKRDELILIGLELNGGTVNVFTDSLGNTNYNITPTGTTAAPETEAETTLPKIDIRKLALNNVTLNYNDLSLKLNTVIRNLSAEVKGMVDHDSISGIIKAESPSISFVYGGEKYLQQASVNFVIPVEIIPSRQFIRLKNSTVSVNDLEVLLNGSVENDTVNKNIITDLNYKFTSWPFKNIIALVPPSFDSYLKGIDADGLLSSEGSIKGLMNDSIMPLMDLRLKVEKGALKYDGFPLPLHDIEGDVTVYTDLKTDAISYVTIRKLNAKTPKSTVKIEGMVNHLFKDIYCNLTTSAEITLDEFNPMIPDSMKIDIRGKASGKVKSSFSLSQLDKMQLEKMKLSGSLTLSNFNAVYDSITVNTDRSKIDFALPNQKASSKSTKFAFASILMDNIKAEKLESYSATLQNASLIIETSDARDTTRIPDLNCSFKMESMSADMDTMSISISKPSGKVTVSPRIESPDQPRIILSYNSEQLKTIIGKNSFTSNEINFETDILEDKTQKDIFLQWLVKGFVDMNQGTITMAGLKYPIEIPALKMNFEPDSFNIMESKILIDRSDFQLKGTLSNILSYYRGDSILKGDFSFVSNTTDISQLMALTSGIGYKDSTTVEKPVVKNTDSTYAGPYMVPERMDLFLTTNIKTATMGIDTATNIIGSVQVHDGILVLDGLSFTTPAAKMQLTAMYRTPRKNHLFLGLDYHMLDIEIEELLAMIPDIDTLMPMLRSFRGKGEFHIAVETYLDSLYNVKKSTLRGASSIRGNDLVLMDGETFSEIAKTLMFNKKTVNKVDSLSAEFTIFRNEIDIYPFLIVMDKYKAVIAGRHNFDMSFNYHISVVDNPLPVKLGIDIKGNEKDLKYSLAKCKYAEYYRPSSRHVVENKQIELRKLIRDALTQKLVK